MVIKPKGVAELQSGLEKIEQLKADDPPDNYHTGYRNREPMSSAIHTLKHHRA
jgi:hypothetical protein